VQCSLPSSQKATTSSISLTAIRRSPIRTNKDPSHDGSPNASFDINPTTSYGLDEGSINYADTQQKLAEMQNQIKMLTQKLEVKQKEYVHDGTNLITDVSSSNCIKWALNCSKILFTKNELIENVLTSSSKTNRGSLDTSRVMLLKGNDCQTCIPC